MARGKGAAALAFVVLGGVTLEDHRAVLEACLDDRRLRSIHVRPRVLPHPFDEGACGLRMAARTAVDAPSEPSTQTTSRRILSLASAAIGPSSPLPREKGDERFVCIQGRDRACGGSQGPNPPGRGGLTTSPIGRLWFSLTVKE